MILSIYQKYEEFYFYMLDPDSPAFLCQRLFFLIRRAAEMRKKSHKALALAGGVFSELVPSA